MKNISLTLVLIAVGGCASTEPSPATSKSVMPATSQSTTANVSTSLFDEAHRCEGVVKYEAEMQRGEMRSRLSCEWTVEPDEWGAW